MSAVYCPEARTIAPLSRIRAAINRIRNQHRKLGAPTSVTCVGNLLAMVSLSRDFCLLHLRSIHWVAHGSDKASDSRTTLLTEPVRTLKRNGEDVVGAKEGPVGFSYRVAMVSLSGDVEVHR